MLFGQKALKLEGIWAICIWLVHRMLTTDDPRRAQAAGGRRAARGRLARSLPAARFAQRAWLRSSCTIQCG